MLCAFQNLELAKKEAALILSIFPFPASRDRSVFSCKIGQYTEFGQILKDKLLCLLRIIPHTMCSL